MPDSIKRILIVAGLMLIGTLAGTFWHTHGGQWWVIPLCAVSLPIVLAAILIFMFVFMTDWSH